VNEAGERVILEVQDELLAPKMYILKSDLQFFDSIMREKMMTHLIVRIDPCKIPTLLNEPAMEITTKYPYDVGEIRRQIPGMLTYNSDVKWEKMCIQKLRWKQFIEVDTVPEYGFCPLSTIHPSEKAFTVNLNIAYFDIETDSKGVKKFGDWRNAHLMEIISYVIFSSAQQHYTYYGWKTTWETTVEEVNAILTEAAQTEQWKGILTVTDEQIVSSDVLRQETGALVDLRMTKVVAGDLVKVLSWYDNEWGYVAMLEKHVTKSILLA